MARIDLDQRQAGGCEAALEDAVIGSGGLNDHALNGMAGKPCGQRAVT
jgi:hypothetical protein